MKTKTGRKVTQQSAAQKTNAKTQNKECPVCGMESTEWMENDGKGVTKNSKLYCSEECANEGAE